jgi:antitoxin (DNA-binding transcriptional repressor) of toxin-antitoxin stability system
MKTLTVSEGRANLGHWLRQAVQGQDVGFVIDGKVVALRPVEVISADYALQEYGLGSKDMRKVEQEIDAEVATARKRGDVHRFTGNADDFH